METLENVNPKLYQKCEDRLVTLDEEDENIVDDFDAREVFGTESLKIEQTESLKIEQEQPTPRRPHKLRKQYSPAMVMKAISYVASGMSKSEAARRTGVPRTTLVNASTGKSIIGKRPGPEPFLGTHNEVRVVAFLKEFLKQGLVLNEHRLATLVKQFMDAENIPNRFKNNMPGRSWCRLFLTRNPELSLKKKSEHYNKNRKLFLTFVLDLIRNINDPEHPLTLEELNVVEQSKVEVRNDENEVNVNFTPTIPHCSMATLIGLSIRVQLLRMLPARFKVSVKVTPGSHASEQAINKQLADKERVAAALENSHLIEVINQCIATTLKN